MKKFLVMAAMVLSSVGAFAQYQKGDFTIQPKVGLSAASSSAEKAKFIAGFVGGVEAEYHFNKLVGLSFGANYSQEGCKFEKSDLSALNVTDDLTFKMNYINVPVLANFYVADGLAVKAGVQVGFKASAKAKCGDEVDMDGAVLRGVTKFTAKSTNISIPIGISYEFSNVCLDARYNIGVSDLYTAEGFFSSGSASGQVLQLTLGYKFAL